MPSPWTRPITRARSETPILALPKGRFLPRAEAVIQEIDNGARTVSARKASLTTTIGGYPFTVKLLKVQDVAALLREGMIDFGICSDEWMAEFRAGVPSCIDLDWCVTRIVFATPERSTGRRRFLRVATPYPNVAHAFLERRGLPYRVLPVFGCPEALVPDICDAVIDCVETGRSLRDNGLVEREVLLESTVRLYLQPHHEGTETASALATILEAHAGGGVESVLASLATTYRKEKVRVSHPGGY